jgi:cytochrome c oxidase assembly protein subunit 15
MHAFASRLSARVSRSCSSSQQASESVAPRVVGYWMLGMSGAVAGMVAVGGITRLTKSGLSMTDWKLQGSLPPMNPEEWEAEFSRYKTFPEWRQRQNMTVDEFKYIFYWEWGHRMLGRSLGLLFIGPFTYFSMRGMIPRRLYPRLGLLFGLGGMQGLVGWWMVKSGLNVSPEQKKEIRVSPYRLATHLGMAFTTYTLLLWTGLDILNSKMTQLNIAKNLAPGAIEASKYLRRFAIFNFLLVGTTVASGAFVAGNDAGRAYNSFPLMGDQWIPEGILEISPLWRNFFENTATVQFDHRVLAMSTLVAVGGLYTSALHSPYWYTLPHTSRMLFHGVAGMACVQVALGITTLLLYVPVSLGVLHQTGSLTLLTLVTCLTHSLNYSRFGRLGVIPVAAAGALRSVAKA